MKAISWVRWLLACCVYTSMWSTTLARHKFRQPQPQIYKKSWPMGPRISMGNSVHMNGPPSNYLPNRPQYKPNNYRVRRPPMFGMVQPWKNQNILGSLSNQGALPQRGPVKEFHSMNKVPEYSPEYRPEQAMPPPTNRGHTDDEKGPIHTIPAPNLSPADKPYNIQSHKISFPQSNLDYTSSFSGPVSASTNNYGFGTTVSSLSPQRVTVTSSPPTYHRYEVTETNEIGTNDYRTVQPSFFTPEFDVTRLSNYPSPGNQPNDVFSNRPSGSTSGLIGTGVQFGHENVPMQTNLHSSLHVGFPGTAVQGQSPATISQSGSIVQSSILGQQSPDLHVGHPAAAGPPLSATQLYDLLNSFPQVNSDQYSGSRHPPQIQQHLLQQQLGQLFQPGNLNAFTPPQMQSFNYDEQSNKQQQQQQQQLLQEQQKILQNRKQMLQEQQQKILQEQQQQLQQHRRQQQIFVGQDYASGRVTADYSLEPAVEDNDRKVNVQTPGTVYSPEVSDPTENHIEYEDTSNQRGQSTYFTQIGREGSLASQYYTTLPSREAAEKLAALAAAGNVNSHLLGQLRKGEGSQGQGSQGMPANHKDDRFYQGQLDPRYQQHPRFAHGQTDEDEGERKQQYGQNQGANKEQTPLRILVPDMDEYEDQEHGPSRGDVSEATDDYDYESESTDQKSQSNHNDSNKPSYTGSNSAIYNEQSSAEFGTRIGPKSQ